MKVLDLRFQGAERVIASFLLDSGEGPVLVETGPESCYPRLVEALRAEGVAPEEVRHVFVTHIHLDHAGAAWRLAELGATVYVHPRGAPHLVDPSRLLASAERIYGDQLKALWGEVRGIPEERVRLLADGEVVALGGLEVQLHGGQVLLHELELGDGLAKLLPLPGVGQGEVQSALHEPHRPRRQGDAPRVQGGEGDPKPLPLLPQDPVLGHPHPVQKDHPRVRRP